MKRMLLVRFPIQSGFRRFLIHVHDLAVTTAALPVSLLIRENFELSDHHIQPLFYGSILILITAFLVFRLTGLQRGMWRYTSPYDLFSILKAVSLILGIFVSIMFLFDRLTGVPRSIIVIFWLVAFAGLAGSRIIYGRLMSSGPAQHGQAAAGAPKRALVLGKLPAAVAVIQKIRALYSDRLKIVGLLSENAETGRCVHGTAILGSIVNFEQITTLLDAQGLSPKLLIIAEPIDASPALQQLAAARNIQFIEAAHLDEIELSNDGESEHQHFFRDRPAETGYLRVKRLVEATLALCALITVLPVIILICVMNLITVGPPVLFTQYRAGRHMHEFFLLKFRTMRDAFDDSGKILSDADRTSYMGSFLRFTRLDELPQLWNVVNGDMALIGPRPLLKRDLPKDQFTVKERYSVRPGLTGWAQVNGGQRLSNDQKMALDLYYIRNATFLLDIRILAMTVRMILFGERVNTHAIEHAKLATATR